MTAASMTHRKAIPGFEIPVEALFDDAACAAALVVLSGVAQPGADARCLSARIEVIRFF